MNTTRAPLIVNLGMGVDSVAMMARAMVMKPAFEANSSELPCEAEPEVVQIGRKAKMPAEQLALL